jgi:hypothetical protein
MWAGACRVAEAQIPVIGRGGADIDARRAAGEPRRRNAGILQRVPGQFEQQALLWVHLRGFARRDTEKLRLEPIDAVD